MMSIQRTIYSLHLPSNSRVNYSYEFRPIFSILNTIKSTEATVNIPIITINNKANKTPASANAEGNVNIPAPIVVTAKLMAAPIIEPREKCSREQQKRLLCIYAGEKIEMIKYFTCDKNKHKKIF